MRSVVRWLDFCRDLRSAFTNLRAESVVPQPTIPSLETEEAPEVPQPNGDEPLYAGTRELELLAEPDLCLAVLDLVFSTPLWVHRRVEQLEVVTEQHVIRSISLDFTEPMFGPTIRLSTGSEVSFVPIDILAKQPLTQFDLVEENGSPVSVLTRRQNGQIAATALSLYGQSVVTDAGEEWTPDLESLVVTIAQADADTADAALSELQAGTSASAEALSNDEGFVTTAQMLSLNFLLIATFPSTAGTRRILKWRYEDAFKRSTDNRNRLERFLEAFALRTMTIEVAVPSFMDCESYHFEAAAPEGIDLVDVVLADEKRIDGNDIDSQWIIGYQWLLRNSSHRANLSVSRTAAGSDVHDEFLDPWINLRVKLSRDGWLRSTTAALFAVTVFLWVSLPTVMDWGNGESEAANALAGGLERDPAALSIAVIGALTVSAARSGQHPYAVRAARYLRRFALAGAGLPFAAAWLLVFPGPGCFTSTTWLVLSIAATLCLAVLAVALLYHPRSPD